MIPVVHTSQLVADVTVETACAEMSEMCTHHIRCIELPVI